jgi:apolipoprotein N-acyltransferase
VYLVTLATAVCAGAVAALLRSDRQHWQWPMGLLVGVVGLGGVLVAVPWTHPDGKPLGVAIVQGAVPQDLKWSPAQRDATFALYRDLSKPVWGTPLVVWPEAALPVLAEEATPFLREQWSAASSQGSALLMGLLSYDLQSGSVRNGLLVLDTQRAPQWYFKRHLVPFGEYFPVPAKVREWMRLSSLAFVDLQPGVEGSRCRSRRACRWRRPSATKTLMAVTSWRRWCKRNSW